MKVGFCGTGLMGTAMILRLLAAGHHVKVWNRTPSKAARVANAGAHVVATPADIVAGSDVIFLCVFDAAAVDEVVFGSQGIATAMASTPSSSVLVDHTSISPSAARTFATHLADCAGAAWIDAPVSGGIAGADAGKLTVMAGGPEDAFERIAEPVAAYAARLVRVGPVGAGQMAKLCNQTILAATLLSIAEAVALARSSGIDPARLPEALAGGWADSKLLHLFVPRMLSSPADVIGTIATLLKDAESIAAVASASKLPMPVSSAALHTLRIATTIGLGNADLSRIIEMLSHH